MEPFLPPVAHKRARARLTGTELTGYIDNMSRRFGCIFAGAICGGLVSAMGGIFYHLTQQNAGTDTNLFPFIIGGTLAGAVVAAIVARSMKRPDER